jgi:YVTN family beta-propeller protein
MELGGMPLKLLPIPGTSQVLVASNGYAAHFIALVDLKTAAVAQRVPIAEGWMGMALTPDGKRVCVSGGSKDRIFMFDLANGKLAAAGEIALPAGTFPAGLHMNKDGSRLYVTGNVSNSLLVVDLLKMEVSATFGVGNKPYTCAITADESTAYVSDWGEEDVAIIDLKGGSPIRKVKVQEKPNDLLLTPDEQRLFVANGNRNTVSVMDTKEARVTGQIDVGLVPKAPLGSTPNALALGPDGKTLYVANADNNALAVLDISQPSHTVSRGFIPTGWYPTAVCLGSASGRPCIVVANGKGAASYPNSKAWLDSNLSGRKSLGDPKNPGYIASLIEGTLFRPTLHFQSGKTARSNTSSTSSRRTGPMTSSLAISRKATATPLVAFSPPGSLPTNTPLRGSLFFSTTSSSMRKSAPTVTIGPPAHTPRTTSRSSGPACTVAMETRRGWIFTTIRWLILPAASFGISARRLG